MRSFLTTVKALFVTTSVTVSLSAIAATGAIAGPINVNSNVNANANVTTNTSVTGTQKSKNGSMVDVGTQANNNASVGINQSNANSGYNTGTNQNANVKGFVNTTKKSNYNANNGSVIRSTTIINGNSNSKINQMNASRTSDYSNQNAEIGFGANVNVSGNNTANRGSSITRGIGVESNHLTTIDQGSTNPYNHGAPQNTNVQNVHNVTISGDNTATNGGVINSQTVSNSTSNITINNNR